MDSVTQFALGASITYTALGRSLGNKAILIGGLIATLPDLDVLISYGDPMKDLINHRTWSHSLFVLALFAPILTWCIQAFHKTRGLQFDTFKWHTAIFLTLITHPLLDSMTTYSTQLLWPLNTTISGSTVFIVDPVYTVPLLIAMLTALFASKKAHTAHKAALIFSTAYLCFAIGAKNYINQKTEQQLQSQNIEYTSYKTVPTPLNSLLWRVVIMEENGYYEGYRSIFDKNDKLELKFHPSLTAKAIGLEQNERLNLLKTFSEGFYAIKKNNNGDIYISDIRMGQNGDYFMTFKIANHQEGILIDLPTHQIAMNRDGSAIISETWDRIWCEQKTY